jgi:hypothetical protein
VQRMKGQMYCTVCTAPCNLRATVQKEATVLVLRAKQAAATFLLPMHKYGRSLFLNDNFRLLIVFKHWSGHGT